MYHSLPICRFSRQMAFKDEDKLVLAKDANVMNENTFDIHDPRNPLNIRRRGEDAGKPAKQRRERTKN